MFGAKFEEIRSDEQPRITVKLQNENNPADCELSGETKIYLCSLQGKHVLVKSNPFGFVALGRDKDGSPLLMDVEKVTSNEKTLFEVPNFGLKGLIGYGGVNLNKATKDLSKIFQEKVLAIDQFFSINGLKADRSLLEKGPKKFQEVVKGFLKDRDDAENELKNIYVEKKYDIELEDGQKLSCQRGTSRPLKQQEEEFQKMSGMVIQCGSFSCGNISLQGKDYKAVMLYDSSPGAFSSGSFHLVSPDGMGPNVYIKKIASAKSQIPLIDNSAFLEASKDRKNPFKDYMNSIFPQSLGEDRQKVAIYKDPNFEQSIAFNNEFCQNNEVIKELIDGKNKTLAKLADLELAQIITVLGNGSLQGYYVDPKKGPELGCLYQGVYLDPGAAKNLDRLKKDIFPDRNVEQTITMDRAKELFKKAQGMKDIAWKYKPDGCYARAHLMARRFEAEGVRVDKVWIKGDLYVPGTEPLIQWNFHVAPIVYVKNDKGEIQKMVIDPSLFETPVTVEEWDNKMSKKTIKGSTVTAFPFPENAALMERSTLAFSSSDPYLPRDSIEMTEDMKMRYANETMKQYKQMEPK